MKISIALCTYNGAKYLREQLESYSVQTRLPDEVVACDDCSTDETVNILDAWAKTVPFEVRIVKNETNLGFAKNFEKAVSLCTKDVVFLSDQDDIWLPEKLERMISVYEKDSETLGVICDGFSESSKSASSLETFRHITVTSTFRLLSLVSGKPISTWFRVLRVLSPKFPESNPSDSRG